MQNAGGITMRARILPAASVFLFAAPYPLAFSQQATAPGNTNPICRVTVVERTVKAVNYQYLSDPAMIDFRGTVLLPNAKGEATVQSRRGRRRGELEAKLAGSPVTPALKIQVDMVDGAITWREEVHTVSAKQAEVQIAGTTQGVMLVRNWLDVAGV
jgi:hypothetical protein